MKKFLIAALVAATALLQGIGASAQFNPYALTPREAKEQSIINDGVLVRAYDRVFLNGKQLKKDEIKAVMSPENYTAWAKGKASYDTGTVIASVGVAGIVVGLAGMASFFITKPEDDTKLLSVGEIVAGAGLGLVLISVPFQIGGLDKMKQAIKDHNDNPPGAVSYFGFTPSGGVGFAVRF